MKSKINKLTALSFNEWKLLLISLGLLPFIGVTIKIHGYKSSQAFLFRYIPPCLEHEWTDQEVIAKARVVARMVFVAARHGIYHANCLERSLVLWFLLAKAGIQAEIRFGINKQIEDKLDAHAWVEVNGINISDSQIKQGNYLVFDN